MGGAEERLDYTFLSFAQNQGVELHAFILGDRLPQNRLLEINYHLLPPIPSYSHPLREVYYRRMEVLDALGVDYALTVDCCDALCLHPLPAFEQLLGNAHVAACVEHLGCRYILGQGYTANFLNGGVFLWDVANSRDIRDEIIARGKSHFRNVADDQRCINEVIQTKHYNRLRILPCQYNYRAYLNRKQRNWPTVSHLDGVMIYHNATSMDDAKKLLALRLVAPLPMLPDDGGPVAPSMQFWRKVKQRLQPWVVK
jgi:hypothetical protein